MSTSDPRVRPHAAVLLGLCALAVVPVVLSYLGVSDVGAFRMFTRPFEQHVALAIRTGDGMRRDVPFVTLEEHLSRDDRRVLMPAVEWAPGETAASLLDAGGARDLCALLCSLHSDAVAADVEVTRRSLPTRATTSHLHAELACQRP